MPPAQRLFHVFKDRLFNTGVAAALYAGAAIYSFFQVIYGNHNNFTIFRSSFYHLISGTSLYQAYPAEHSDFFLYSPVFPLIFSPFALTDLSIGIATWLVFSAAFCFWVFTKLPLPDDRKKFFIFFMFFNVLNNLEHTQTNIVMLALMLLFWVLQDKQKYLLAGLCLALCFSIKGYGAIIGLLVLLDKKWWLTSIYTGFWILVFNAALLILISPSGWLQQYKDWFTMISGDSIKESFSVYGIMNLFSLGNLPEKVILVPAFLILAVFIGGQLILKERNKTLIVAFILIWATIFNRGAESATFIFAVAGIILWYLGRPESKFTKALFWFTIILSSVFPTGVVPFIDLIKTNYYISIFICLFILADMIFLTLAKFHQRQLLNSHYDF
jgi:hypothetical protein